MKTRRNNNAEFLCLHLHGIRCVGFCKDDYGDKKETHPPQKSPQTIIHKIKGGNYYKKGLCYNHGNEILLRFQSVQHRQKADMQKEHNNPYDSETIKVTMKTSARSVISQIRRTPKPTAQWAPAQSISMSRKNSKSE